MEREDLQSIANGATAHRDADLVAHLASAVVERLRLGEEIGARDVQVLQAAWRLRLRESVRAAKDARAKTRWFWLGSGAVGGGAFVLVHPFPVTAMAILSLAGLITVANAFAANRRSISLMSEVREVGDPLHLLKVEPPTVAWAQIEDSPLNFEVSRPQGPNGYRLPGSGGRVMDRLPDRSRRIHPPSR